MGVLGCLLLFPLMLLLLLLPPMGSPRTSRAMAWTSWRLLPACDHTFAMALWQPMLMRIWSRATASFWPRRV